VVTIKATTNENIEYGLKLSSTLNKTQLASRTGNITAMVQIGSVGGALIAFIACDKLGEPEFT
jgi:ABC-type Fe3+/spermidine/putrescine transport system ATPase subunit